MLCTSQRQVWLYCDHGYCVFIDLDIVRPLSLAANSFLSRKSMEKHEYTCEVDRTTWKPTWRQETFLDYAISEQFYSSDWRPLLRLVSSCYNSSMTAALYLPAMVHSSDDDDSRLSKMSMFWPLQRKLFYQMNEQQMHEQKSRFHFTSWPGQEEWSQSAVTLSSHTSRQTWKDPSLTFTWMANAVEKLQSCLNLVWYIANNSKNSTQPTKKDHMAHAEVPVVGFRPLECQTIQISIFPCTKFRTAMEGKGLIFFFSALFSVIAVGLAPPAMLRQN